MNTKHLPNDPNLIQTMDELAEITKASDFHFCFEHFETTYELTPPVVTVPGVFAWVLCELSASTFGTVPNPRISSPILVRLEVDDSSKFRRGVKVEKRAMQTPDTDGKANYTCEFKCQIFTLVELWHSKTNQRVGSTISWANRQNVPSIQSTNQIFRYPPPQTVLRTLILLSLNTNST